MKEVDYLPAHTSFDAKVDLAGLIKVDFVNQLLNQSLKAQQFIKHIHSLFNCDLMKTQTAWIATGKKDEYPILLNGNFASNAIENSLIVNGQAPSLSFDNVYFAASFPDCKKPGFNNFLSIIFQL